jgi:hypothetical protein
VVFRGRRSTSWLGDKRSHSLNDTNSHDALCDAIAGRKSSVMNIITCLGDETCTLQSINRTPDAELLPNIKEVRIPDGQSSFT